MKKKTLTSGMEVLVQLTNAPIAQWIERLIPVQEVTGSTPARRSINMKHKAINRQPVNSLLS